MHSANMIHGKLALFPLHEAIAAGVQIRPPVCLHHELTLLMKVACHPLLVMCKLCFDVAGCMLLTAVVGLTAAAAAAATAAAAAAAAAFVIVLPQLLSLVKKHSYHRHVDIAQDHSFALCEAEDASAP